MPEYKTSDGLTLHYMDDNDGPAVLMLAGLTRNSADFNFLIPHLPEYRLIRLDYRGRGLSDYHDDFTTYNVKREARDAIELLDHLELEKTCVIGTSRGGLIAMLLSAICNYRLNGIVMNDIGPQIEPEGLFSIMEYIGKIPPFDNLDDAALALQANWADGFPDVPLSRWRRQAEHMWHEKPEGGIGLRYDPRLRDVFSMQVKSGEEADLWPMFDTMREIPLASIRGENSDLFSAATQSKMRERHPEMITAVVPNRGHVPFLDEPESVSAIRKLLEDSQYPPLK
ncbi:MAG: alpha/beta hydrolase [Roseovarius sp.]|nr:alpha/beta hydrolase [Roseovarius sp.]MCY4206900.1 alpha/beta hydrolase [Roseovarius sp.]MCY4290278.1 alpha/beta hydrolase [Roseovarius sp.]